MQRFWLCFTALATTRILPNTAAGLVGKYNIWLVSARRRVMWLGLATTKPTPCSQLTVEHPVPLW